MMPESGKKIIILYILQILRKYTDFNHTMTQQQIAEVEMVGQQRISTSIRAAMRRIKKYFSGGSQK